MKAEDNNDCQAVQDNTGFFHRIHSTLNCQQQRAQEKDTAD